jgi:hypothetical protein
VSLVGKVIEAIREKGPGEGLRFVVDRAKTYVVDPREIILLAVDLRDPKNLVRDRDRKDGFALVDLDRAIVPRVASMLERTAPERIPNLSDRLDQGMSGFVAEDAGSVAGYVFYRRGSSDPTADIHPDLAWLPIAPREDEVYTFDYFIPEDRRGLGNLFARGVQARQAELGMVRSYGYVYAHNKAALWLYRTIGWKEIGRVKEHKLLLRFSVIQDRLYFVRQYDRALIGPLPQAWIER